MAIPAGVGVARGRLLPEAPVAGWTRTSGSARLAAANRRRGGRASSAGRAALASRLNSTSRNQKTRSTTSSDNGQVVVLEFQNATLIIIIMEY